MLLSEAITTVRERSRTSSDFITDASVANDIDLAIKEFVTDVQGIIKYTYLSLSPKFWTHTGMAINLTITGGTNALAATDVVITDYAREGAAGDVVAADLQAKIREAGAASVAVSFSTTTWKFTVDASDSTSIDIDSPSNDTIYADPIDLLFATSGEKTGTSWTGNVPEDCTIEIDLPSDFDREKAVEWDQRELVKSSFDLFVSPQSNGNPSCYQIWGKKMRIAPVPDEQELLQLIYFYTPETVRDFKGYQELGLSNVIDSQASGLATTTQYYFKITADGGSETEYDITTAATVTFAAVIALMNTATSGVCTWAMDSGDIRCTSDTEGTSSTISLAVGTTGTDLFATLTGYTAFDTAVSALTREIELPDEAEEAVVYGGVARRYEASADEKRALFYHGLAKSKRNAYSRKVRQKDSKYRQSPPRIARIPRVTV